MANWWNSSNEAGKKYTCVMGTEIWISSTTFACVYTRLPFTYNNKYFVRDKWNKHWMDLENFLKNFYIGFYFVKACVYVVNVEVWSLYTS